MASSIKGLDGGSIGASGSGSPIEQVRASTAANTSTGAPPSHADDVQITDSARRLASLAQALQGGPEIDSQRVQALQQAIEGGHYAINPERIADGLLQFERLSGNGR